nr:DUF1983 domain-containing protein [Pseudomonas putida]
MSLQRVGTTSVDVVGIYAGAYLARVRAVSAFDITSIWKSSVLTQLNGKEGLPPAVTFLDTESLLFGIGIKWGLPAGAEDTQRTELWYSEGTELGLATKLADLSYPQNEYVMQGLRAGQRFYFWARLVDRSGNIGPFFPVEGTLVSGMASADASAILEQIKDQITESELGQELTKRIDLIDMNGPGSVNERVGAAKTELAEQISEVNNALASTKGNLEQQITAVGQSVSEAQAELQEQIDQIADLADSMPYKPDQAYTAGQGVLGEDGKLYQAKDNVPAGNPPPNATYWTDVGQAVQTANGLAARVSDVETDVSTLDGKTTAQATQIGGLQSSLTTTNQNVATAQQAADAANTLAGGKGKVIIQSAAPAVADRLAQNLWIDTTGNANTPKRWSGSAWVAVTDKAATDAAAAAQSALSQVALKADATVVNNLSTRVSDAEGKLTSQASRMDGMQTSIDGKASSQALQQVSSRVTATEQKDATQDQQLTSQSQALTSLTDSVSKKAEASTVQNLSNTVSQQGQDLTAHGQSLTRIDAALPLLSGENLLANSSFEDLIADGSRPKHWAISAGAARSLVPSPLTSSASALRLSGTVAAGGYIEVISGLDDGRPRVKVTGGANYTLSVYARGAGAPGRLRMYIQFLDAAGVVLSAPWTADGFILTESYARYTLTGMAPAAATQARIYVGRLFNTGTAAVSLWMEIDNAQLQEGTVATAYQPSVLAANEVSAEATSALSARVDKNEQGIASTSVQITQLSGQLDTTNQNVTNAQQAAQAASDAAGAKGKVIYQSAVPAVADRLAQNLWIDTTNNANTPKRWSGSAWVAVTDKAATDAAAAAQDALSKVATKAEAATVQALSNTVDQHGTAITANGQAVTNINASLSQVGGENLFYNPSFERVGSTAGLADGWITGTPSGVTRIPSIVASTLDPNGKAQRYDVTGIDNSARYLDTYHSPKFPSVSAGQAVSVSIYVKVTAGCLIRWYLQPRNAAGTTIATQTHESIVATGDWQRLVLEGREMPAGAVACPVIFRVFGASSTPQSAVVEIDRAQFEIGKVATGWRDNGQLDAADITANAAATTALTGRVATTEAGLTSASSQLTQLDNSIGDAGGENLLYNPTFNQVNTGDTTLPDGWVREGAAQNNSSMVESWLNAGERAFRSAVTGVTNGSPYLSLIPAVSKRVKVGGSQIITSSIYARRAATSGPLSIRLYIQCLNAAGTVISSVSTGLQAISVEGSRFTLTATTPAEAVAVALYYRVHGATSSAANGTFELARPQVEYASRASGWRDSGLVNAANNAATSTAVENLTSTVSQQGSNLSSVAGRTTSLENGLTTTNQNVTTAQQAAQAAATAAGAKGEVIYGSTAPATDKRLAQNLWIDTTGNANTPKRWNGSAWVTVTDKVATDAAAAAANALSQVATKAEASALQTLANRVTAAEGVNTSQSTSITDLNNSVGAIQGALGSSGLDPAPGALWQFDTTTEGWVVSSATLAQGAGFIKITATGADPQLMSSAAATLSIAGSLYSRVRARITRRAGATTDWDGQLFYSTAGHGFAGTYRAVAANPNLSVGQSAVVEWDMANLTAGGTDWVDNTITRLRLDLGNSSGGVFDVDWIAVGRVAPSASSRAVESLSSTVAQQGDKITAEALRTDGLYTSVANANAAIQNEAAARTSADSALSQQIQTTQSSLGDTNASVQQLSTAHAALDQRANATYTVKLQATASGQYVAAGFGLGLVNNGGMFQSTFAVMVDQFAVLNPAGNGFVSPFAIQNNQVFMNDAFIRDASITNAKIADAAITNAKIGVAEIDTLRIRGNAVTVPVSVTNNTTIYGRGSGVWIDLAAVAMTLDTPGSIQAMFGCYQGFGSGIRQYRFRLWVNSTLIAEGGGDWADGFPNLQGAVYAGAGQHVISVSWWGENSGVSVSGMNIFAMGAKR